MPVRIGQFRPVGVQVKPYAYAIRNQCCQGPPCSWQPSLALIEGFVLVGNITLSGTHLTRTVLDQRKTPPDTRLTTSKCTHCVQIETQGSTILTMASIGPRQTVEDQIALIIRSSHRQRRRCWEKLCSLRFPPISEAAIPKSVIFNVELQKTASSPSSTTTWS